MLTHPLARFAACLLTTAWLGCSTAKTVDVLESRLRHQEDMLAGYESEMKRVKSELGMARHEAEDLRLQLAESGQSTVPAEESGALFRTAGIQFSALMTGGADLDGEAGHDGLSVVLVPHDHDGELVKLPGNVELEAFDLSAPGGAQRIGHWTFGQREIHNYWHKGVIQSGYQFELPWQTPPTSEKVLLVGHLSAANGRKFDTTLTVKIDPPASGLVQSEGHDIPPQVTGRDVSSAIKQASATPRESEIIWAEGEGPPTEREDRRQDFVGGTSTPPTRPSPFFQHPPTPAEPAQARSGSGADFSRELNRSSILSVRPSSPRQDAPAESRSSTNQAPPSSPPPALEDWWADDDWATETAPADESAVRTSDSFTDETIPRYR